MTLVLACIIVAWAGLNRVIPCRHPWQERDMCRCVCNGCGHTYEWIHEYDARKLMERVK